MCSKIAAVMKISVLIVAHNEAGHIASCVQSVLNQTLAPSEIIVICHNCTDTTVSILRSFNTVKAIEYTGPAGVPYARIKGFEEVTGDIVACLDGDGTVSTVWLHNLVTPLIEHQHISLVAGYVVLTNSLFSRLTSFWQFVILKKIFKARLNCFAWGSNFACRKADYEKVGFLCLARLNATWKDILFTQCKKLYANTGLENKPKNRPH
jgi:glycosyltransferase involved in cell wall biosynthesis